MLKGEVTAIIDSSPVIGAGAVADTDTLVRQVTHQLAAVLAAQRPKAQALAGRIPAAKPRIDWHAAAARRAHLAELVAVARALLAQAVGSTIQRWSRRPGGSARCWTMMSSRTR